MLQRIHRLLNEENASLLECDEALVPFPGLNFPYLPDISDTSVKSIVQQFRHLFSEFIQASNVAHHSILLQTEKPICTSPRRLPLSYASRVTTMLSEYDKMRIIKHSDSPYCSPVIIVPKNGSLRLCYDY